jgi:hypothetical protein
MGSGVARSAECNKVALGIIAVVAAKLLVVDFQVRHRTARLTSPAIATQYLLPQVLVRHRIKPDATGLLLPRMKL